MAIVSFVLEDTMITIDGVGYSHLDLSGIDSNIWAIQWNTSTSTGHIEYSDGTDNLTISDISAYQSYIDLHIAQKATYDAAVVTAADEQTTLEATYGYKRMMAHAEVGDQLDQMYHDAVDGTTTWKDAVAAVKSAHPK